MSKFKYIKNIGYIYDLFNIFILYFNSVDWYNDIEEYSSKSREDYVYFDEIIKDCGKISMDLYPLFYRRKRDVCFITNYYFHNIFDYNDLNFYNICENLKDKDEFLKNLIEFYFNEKDIKNVNINDQIEKMNEEIELKYRLIRMFSNINEIIDLLIQALTTAKALLDKIYEKRDFCLKEQINYFADENNFIKVYQFYNIIKDDQKETVYSISLIDRYAYLYKKNDLLETFIFGDDCKNYFIENDDKKDIEVDTTILGKIISEDIRIKILELLKEHGELYTGEICKLMNMKMTAVFHHLNMMYSVKMLKIRNEGRKVFYNINNTYFTAAKKALSKFMIKEIKNDEKME